MRKMGGYGNTIEIQHDKRHKSLYAHLNKFSEKLKQGSRVSQGQIIGYVGRTGMATGPHLHYEFHIDGIHRDPQKAKLPGTPPLPKQIKVEFDRTIAPLKERLATLQSITPVESDTLAMR